MSAREPQYTRPKTSRPLSATLALLTCVGGVSLSACGGGQTTKRSAPSPLSEETQSTQARLGPILGEVTREKILDRLDGYELCGLSDPTQRGSLRFQIHELERGWKLAEVECFFFGFQGIYQHLVVSPSSGLVTPIEFEGAPPAPSTPGQGASTSAVHVHRGSAEVCGVPQFDPKTYTLTSTCKGDASGRCGAYAEYMIAWREGEPTPVFEPKLLTAQSCEMPSSGDNPREWPKR